MPTTTHPTRRFARAALVTGALLAPLAVPDTASATRRTIVVTPGGSVQDAIDRAGPGTTVVVRRGVYAEHLLIRTDGLRLLGEGARLVPPADAAPNVCTGITGSEDAPVHAAVCVAGDVDLGTFDPILGHRPVAVNRRPVTGVTVQGITVEGAANAVVIAGGDGARIEDVRVDGARDYGLLAAASPRTVYRENRVENGTGAIAGIGMCVEGSPGSVVERNAVTGFVVGVCVSSSTVTVRRNVVRRNHFGIYLDPGYGDIVVRQNLVTDNTRDDGVPMPSGIGIYVDASHDVRIEGNTVTGNVGDNLAGFGMGAGGVVVTDNPWLGVVAHDVVVTGNTMRDNGDGTTSADLWSTATGTGLAFDGNRCRTSSPAGLCRR